MSSLTRLDGVTAILVQFIVFPPVARHYGSLKCLRVTSILYPIAYFLTPFTVLIPDPTTAQIALSLVMMIKVVAGVFAFPCTTILLTNSAKSLRLLGTLNGVATATSAVGRAIGPSISGPSFTLGIKIGWVILPFFVLTVFGILAHIPVWWLEEGEGFGPKVDESESESDDETLKEDTPILSSSSNNYGTPGGSTRPTGMLEAIRSENRELVNESAIEEDLYHTDHETDERHQHISFSSATDIDAHTHSGGELTRQEGHHHHHGGRRLSTALSETMSGLGTGGVAYE